MCTEKFLNQIYETLEKFVLKAVHMIYLLQMVYFRNIISDVNAIPIILDIKKYLKNALTIMRLQSEFAMLY